MSNRLFYTVKLSSSLLREHKYNLNASFYQMLHSGMIVSLSDSQMLHTILEVVGRNIDKERLELLYEERDRLKKSKSIYDGKAKQIIDLQDEIYQMMFVPEYVTVTIDNSSDYARMFKKGFILNGKKYERMSCSASQARVSTIVFVDSSIRKIVKEKLDCGRDLSHPLAPSKYNAYLGLYSSASKPVTMPRYCIVPDYIEEMNVDVNWSIQTDMDKDDIIEDRTIKQEFNRFDGSGIVSPNMAMQWGIDLDEDYTPCQFCIRYAFTKGLLNEFDFVEWCRDENNENYIIKDIWGNDVDLREVDVILTEGMTKLWDSWPTQEDYQENCIKNGIQWRITKYAPKQDKSASTMNYQYIQTLNLNEEQIQKLCEETVNYIKGVNCDDPYYTMLFCAGKEFSRDDVDEYMNKSDDYWMKTLILDNNLLNDKYTLEKIRSMIVTKIEQACLGRIIVQGNYQAIVPDNYALMQWITGNKVTGLLKDGEFYSQFWLKRGVNRVNCARSPMTWRGENYVATIPNVEVD